MCNDESMAVVQTYLKANDLRMPLVLQPYYTTNVLPMIWQGVKSLTDRLLDSLVCSFS